MAIRFAIESWLVPPVVVPALLGLLVLTVGLIS